MSWGFTAVLGTPQCRPGNIVLATEYSSSGSVEASASLLGAAVVFAGATVEHHAAWTVEGQAVVEALSQVHAHAGVHITGVSSLTAQSKDADAPTCTLAATSYLSFNPYKIQIISVLGPSFVPKQYQQASTLPRPAVPGQPPRRSQTVISLPSTQPRKTKVGGVQGQ